MAFLTSTSAPKSGKKKRQMATAKKVASKPSPSPVPKGGTMESLAKAEATHQKSMGLGGVPGKGFSKMGGPASRMSASRRKKGPRRKA